MKRHEICVVEVTRAAILIVESGSAHGDQIITFELPVNILKPVFLAIWVRQHNCVNTPFAEVGRADKRQRISYARRLWAALFLWNIVHERPVQLRLRIKSDRKLFRRTGKSTKPVAGSKLADLPSALISTILPSLPSTCRHGEHLQCARPG